MAIGLKNAGNLLADWDKTPGKYQQILVENFDFNVIEACVSLSPASQIRTDNTDSVQ